ncbi:MAG TPA: VWA domain-containing protein, partial [Planctomycetaceae bacterium]|nr:VWA domain-containing protein [Planctomycetaceae bacterium]
MTFLQNLIERALGVPPAEPGQATQWNFASNFPWPAWLLLLFVMAAGAFVLLVYVLDASTLRLRQWGLLAVLRMATIAVLLFMLSEAVLSIERTGLPYVVLLIDVSGSMDTPDQYQKSDIQKSADRLIANAGLNAPTRLNLAKALLTRNDGDFLRQLQSRHKLRIYTFADGVSWLGNRDVLRPADVDALLPLVRDLKPTGDQTRPGTAVRTVLNELRGTPPSAVLVISDGVTTTTDSEKLSAVADYARSKGTSVYTVGVGNAEPMRDLSLFDTLVDEVAFVDDPITFSAKLKGSGYEGKKVEVVLKQSGSDKILSRREVQIPAEGEPAKVEVTFTPTQVGEFDYVLEAKPQPKEFRLDNNRELRHVTVTKAKLRVLMIDSVPRYEFRFLKALLEREEKTIEFSTVLQDADPEYAGAGGEGRGEDRTAMRNFPVTKEELFQYDVVLFGDVDLAYLSPQVLENLREFVAEKGGGLMMIAGPYHNPLEYRGTPLETLLPIELATARAPAANATITESFQPQLTVAGSKGSSIFRFADDERESQEIWNNLPGFFWSVDAPDVKAGAVPLAVHPTRTGSKGKLPIIVMQRIGSGKVIFHATDDTWRWRFRTGDLYFGRYWVQVIRYLCRSRLLGKDRTAELTTDRAVYQRGDPVYLRVRFLDDRAAPQTDDGVTVMLERPGDPQRKVKLARLPQAPTVFEGQVPPIPDGSYHAWIATPAFSESPPSKDFRVESPLREKQSLSMDFTELNQVADRTRGRYYSFADADALPRDLPP